MTELDLSRITIPLRLAAGSHEEGSGKGCAMNVVSYVNGDAKITDYPPCSARPLTRLVQVINDRLAGADGYLSPENALIVLDLGFATMGTADAPQSSLHAWYAELLDSPEWGVSRFATDKTLPSITAVADLMRKSAGGGSVSGTEWITARKNVAAADADAAAAAYAAAVAAVAVAFADAAAAYAAAADAYAAGAADAARVEHARQAISAWRRLAKLDEVSVDVKEVDSALAKMSVKA